MRPRRRTLDRAQCCRKLRAGFSVLELIGLLAILVILATLLLPRVLETSRTERAVQGVNQARTEEAVAAIRAVKAAAAAHYARYGSLASRNGIALQVAGSYENYDRVLVSEQLLDRPFSPRTGRSAVLRLVDVSGRATASRFDPSGSAVDPAGPGAAPGTRSAYLLEAVISGVTEVEAKALNDALDGPGLGANPGEDDRQGEVTYARIPPGGLGVVRVHITRN